MSTINFSTGDISLLRLHYLQEYNNTRKKLEDIISILNKLGISDTSAEFTDDLKLMPEAAPVESTTPSAGKRKYTRKNPAAGTAAPTPVKMQAATTEGKRRGRKPKKMSWAKFVAKTLAGSETPLTAPELLVAGTHQFNITDANRTKAMQALQATLFRLTKKTNELKSEKVKGSYVNYSLNK